MTLLQRGSQGAGVVQVQQRLAALGFDPGPIDGRFGPATEAAVRAFQQHRGLSVDGLVGPRTHQALAPDRAPVAPPAAPVLSVHTVARLFPGAPRANVARYLPHVLDALAEVGLSDAPMILMALATIRAETAGFAPISEFVSRFNTSAQGHPFDRYDHRRDLGNQGPPDGERFRGRGFIQLTGRFNYRRYGQAIGLGDRLITEPDLANEPRTAARLLAHFLKDKEAQIRQALGQDDLAAARRLVNGGRHGLQAFSETFQTGQRLLAAAPPPHAPAA